MQLTIEILEVKVNNMGKYNMFDVAYKDLGDGGKVAGRKIPDFIITEGKNVLQNAKTGDVLTVEAIKELSKKDGKEYWQWKKFSQGGSVQPTTKSGSATTVAPRSNYETPEERKQRQDYIIRQSSLSNAIAVLKTDKAVPKTEEVLDLAEQFVIFVYGNKTVTDPMEGLEDSLPF